MEVQLNTPDRFAHMGHLPAWIARPFYHAGYRYPTHRHTYCEVFWVERGVIRHTVGGREELLQPGDVRFIHADTIHALGADQPAVLVNLAFPTAMLAELAPFAGELPFRAGAAPGWHLPAAGLTALAQWTETLADPQLDRLQVGAFLLWLLGEGHRVQRGPGDGTPPWLTLALASFDHPVQLAQGVPRLTHLAGRSAGHLARAIRKRFGCTTIQLVNRRRLAWLAQQLRSGDRPVPELAAECGLVNLGNCYRQFRAAYGCPPGEYRRQAQSAAPVVA